MAAEPQSPVTAETADELWDASAQRRALLQMSMSERLEVVAALFAQSHLFDARRS